jgi:hypothetical protein
MLRLHGPRTITSLAAIATAIFRGSDPFEVLKRPPQNVRVGETRCGRDFLQRQVGGHQEAFRPFDSAADDLFVDAVSDCGEEPPFERPPRDRLVVWSAAIYRRFWRGEVCIRL